MMNSKCKVSVIMPSLNVADYIDECILSALDQTLEDIEMQGLQMVHGKSYQVMQIRMIKLP